MPAIIFPTGVFLARDTALPLTLGKVYVGSADLNPKTLANRINVTIVNEDGTETIIAPAQQPLILSVGGMMNYPYNTGGTGTVVQMKVSSQFSCWVDDADDVKQYYFPRAVVNDATFVGDVVIDGDTTINGDILIVGGSYVNYQREAVLDVEAVDGIMALPVQEAGYFNGTIDGDTTIVFEGVPSVVDGYGQTWMFTVDYVSGVMFFEEDGYVLERRSVTSPALDADTKNKFIISVSQPGLVFYEVLKDIVPNV
jgi:hypothetical protein